MPRSFLVKKVKLDDFSTGADLENVYRHRTDLSLRLHDKGTSINSNSRFLRSFLWDSGGLPTCCALKSPPDAIHYN